MTVKRANNNENDYNSDKLKIGESSCDDGKNYIRIFLGKKRKKKEKFYIEKYSDTQK